MNLNYIMLIYRKKVVCIISQYIFTFLLLYALLTNRQPSFIPRTILWTSVYMNIVLAVTIILSNKSPTFLSLISLLLIPIFIKLYSSPYVFNQYGADYVFELQFSNTIIETGRWDPTSGSGWAHSYYGYFPANHLFLSCFAMLSSVNLFLIGKYIYIQLFTLLHLIIVFLIVKRILSNKKIIPIIMLLFSANIWLSYIHVSRRTIADTFILFSLYLLVKIFQEENSSSIHTFFLVLFSFLISIGDHAAIYLYLPLLLAFFIYNIIVTHISLLSQFCQPYCIL